MYLWMQQGSNLRLLPSQDGQSPKDSLHASIFFFAGRTRVELAPYCVTGRHLNRLTYIPSGGLTRISSYLLCTKHYAYEKKFLYCEEFMNLSSIIHSSSAETQTRNLRLRRPLLYSVELRNH